MNEPAGLPPHRAYNAHVARDEQWLLSFLAACDRGIARLEATPDGRTRPIYQLLHERRDQSAEELGGLRAERARAAAVKRT